MRALTRSEQDYLKALHVLAPAGETVATSSLAARLGVSAPSVTSMLGKLSAARLVAYTPRGGARLTAPGRRRAVEIVRRHRILEAFLVNVLGLDWADVHDDAEILEHHISDRVLDAIDRHMGHPGEDPHGHLIPDRKGRIRPRALMPLRALGAGQRGVVREIRDDDRARMGRWKQAGLVPGAVVMMRAVNAADGVFDVEIAGRRHVSGREGLEGVWVEPARGTRHDA